MKVAKRLTVNGITDSVCGWARRNHLSANTIYLRLYKGYSDEDAVEPVNNEEYRKKLLRRLWHGRWVFVG